MLLVVGVCVLVGLMGAYFLWLGYQHLLWKYYEHIFVVNLKKYEEKQSNEKTFITNLDNA